MLVSSVGMLYAAAPIVEVYNRLKAPYSIGKPAIAIGAFLCFVPIW